MVLGLITCTLGLASSTTNAGSRAPAPATADAVNPEIATNRMIRSLKDSEALLALDIEELNSINVATTLHRLAVVNKRRRAGRDALLRDARFETLVDATLDEAPNFSPRSVSDVLWSYATLQHWPPKLLTPLLTSVSVHLTTSEQELEEAARRGVEAYEARFDGQQQRGGEADATDGGDVAADGANADSVFQPQHLSTMVWALARLQCKPTRLIERIELLACACQQDFNMQNCANLLWGFAKLNYQPVRLLPQLCASMLAKEEMLAKAKPVEVADLATGLAILGFDRRAFADVLGASPETKAVEPLLLAVAERASPDAVLADFSSRQLVTMIWSVTRLKLVDSLPDGRLDEWIGAVRAAHLVTPLLAQDARNLERSLGALGMDSTWISRSEILRTWGALAAGLEVSRTRKFSEDELKSAFNSIDTDSSGDIDLEELRVAIRATNPDVDEDELQRMIALGDVDGDQEVSFYEFKKLITLPLERSL